MADAPVATGAPDRLSFMELGDFAPQMFELHAAGEYEAARQLVVDAQPHLRDDDAQTVEFWRICLDARTGRGDAALDELEAALSRGWWYGVEMLADNDLDTIRDDPRFDAITSQSRKAQTKASSRPCFPIVADPDSDLRGTLVALLASGGRSTHTARMWAPALASGYRTVAADSSQRVTSDRATWADLDRAIADVTSQVEDHPAPVIIGGRSLGAAVALHLANTGTVTAAGVVLVAPTIRWDLVEPARPSPTVILAGENDTDRLRAAALDVADFLRQARSPVDYQLVPGMGHFYPDDFAELLVEALKWIENQGTG